jgi:O-glycosyl hydrolase
MNATNRDDRALSRRRFLAYGALAAGASLTPRMVAAQEKPGTVPTRSGVLMLTIDAAPIQTMQGFGASGAWWPNDLVRFDPAVREHVANLLFGRDGIALSAYRYNIGGGGVGVKKPVRAPETFLVTPGEYEWGRDPGGRLFLQLAAERGVPILVGFANSAPPVWTTTEESFGGSLIPGAEPAYAQYLVDVVEHIRIGQGIRLSFLSPMNEPDHLFEQGNQEGMAVPVEQRADLVRTLGVELDRRAPYCRITADESSRTGEHFLRESARWLEETEAARYTAAFAHHRYDFPNETILRAARELSEDYDRPLWCTEICCFDTRTGAWGQQYDPTIRGGLMMANLIAQGLIQANDAAFHWWVACSSEIGADLAEDPDAAKKPNSYGWNDGLLYYDPRYAETNNQAIYTTKRYYTMGHFSRYVRPGARRHDVRGAPGHITVLAFSDDGSQHGKPIQVLPSTGSPRSWSIIVINNGRAVSSPTALDISVPLGPGLKLIPDLAVATSDTFSLDNVDLPTIAPDGLLSLLVPSQTIATYLLREAVSVDPIE